MANFSSNYPDLPAFLSKSLPGTTALLNSSVGSDEDCSYDGTVCQRDGDCSSHTICGSDGCTGDTGCSKDSACYYDYCGSDGVCTSDVQPQPPSEAGSITATSTTKNSIKIWFSEIDGATSYRVFCRLANDASDVTEDTKGVTNLYYTFQGLEPNTEYMVNYKGVNAIGEGPWASAVRVTTDNSSICYIYSGGDWQNATPYVFSGTWREVTASVYSNGWKS